MISERSSGVSVQGNMSGEAYRAGIDDENMGHIIGLFTDLYSDPEKAVIREYSTNARDSHVEAGVNEPIRITLPTAIQPHFIVQDYGVGLSAEDIQKIYSRYGTSTKRATNDQNGMLGLGCKSALTYAEQFTVESVKDGVLTICMISREDDGVPVFTVLSSVPTSARNGTKVTVPVRRYNAFPAKAAEFFKHWAPGTVLVNDKAPERQEGLWLNDNLCLVKRNGYYDSSSHEVVMGGVAYPVENGRLVTGTLPDNYRLIAHVAIGAVSFTPSREALMYTSQTKATLSSLGGEVAAAAQGAVQRKIDQAPDRRAAIVAMREWRDLCGDSAKFTYKNDVMPERVAGGYVWVERTSRKMNQHSKLAPNTLQLQYVPDTLFVTGYSPTSFTASHKRKLLQYADDNGLSPRFFALTFASALPPTTTHWITRTSQIVSWDDVKKVVLPKDSPVWRHGRPTGTYDALVQGDFKHLAAADIDQDEPIFYCRAMNSRQGDHMAKILHKWFPTATVVYLPENRYAKFMRFFPEAKSYSEGLQAAYDKWVSGLGEGVRLGMAISEEDDLALLEKLDPRKIDDPALRRAIHIYKNTKSAVQRALRDQQQFKGVMRHIDRTASTAYDCPLKRYTLLASLSLYGRVKPSVLSEVHIYLNASYAARA